MPVSKMKGLRALRLVSQKLNNAAPRTETLPQPPALPEASKGKRLLPTTQPKPMLPAQRRHHRHHHPTLENMPHASSPTPLLALADSLCWTSSMGLGKVEGGEEDAQRQGSRRGIPRALVTSMKLLCLPPSPT
ncbi:hypothetical protein GGTG_11943 [Gaeumannomyces tritici R3-111a-1]|uniref:Uncharacterized protein n=1 Tax=Gaeumannomyces tritici (strain R3-111a-1) TaxID=644352 RepID=J3PEL2_GAET3|nr:hypothetical protein GGTG_11943 [Gaeumannomyces tritici R3-111a-1]EJT70920.1 hypothetical protein GGTG_11943 [Gaeumannomyces tritici R3-111a-1]